MVRKVKLDEVLGKGQAQTQTQTEDGLNEMPKTKVVYELFPSDEEEWFLALNT